VFHGFFIDDSHFLEVVGVREKGASAAFRRRETDLKTHAAAVKPSLLKARSVA
jgi:hypothetical protein